MCIGSSFLIVHVTYWIHIIIEHFTAYSNQRVCSDLKYPTNTHVYL